MLSWPLFQVAGRPTALLVSAIYLTNAMILSTCIFYYSYLNYLLDQYCFRRVSFNIILLGLQRKKCHQDKRNTIRDGDSFALSTANTATLRTQSHYAAHSVLRKIPRPHPPFMANAILNFHFFLIFPLVFRLNNNWMKKKRFLNQPGLRYDLFSQKLGCCFI